LRQAQGGGRSVELMVAAMDNQRIDSEANDCGRELRLTTDAASM